MKGRKKLREKSPGKPERKGSAQKPGEGKFAPIIEELGRMKTRLEADASYLSTRQLSLQERTQMEIEGELLRKEQDVRVDFDAAFRQRPQVLVEMVSALRRYGDVDVMRNLVFAAETLYGDKLRELPGGIEFWEDLKREVAPLPHPPALTPADLRIQRLQAIEIFREAIVSYDMLSDSAGSQPARGTEAPVTGSSSAPVAGSVPTSPAPPGPEPETPAQADPAPAEPVREPPAPVTEAPPPQVGSSAEPDPAPAPPVAPVEPSATSPAGPPPDEQAPRLDQMARRMKQQEESLKNDCDALLAREQDLLALEKRLEEKEKQLRSSEEEAGKRLSGREEELSGLRKREAELAAELEAGRELHRKTAAELERALRQAADGAATADSLREREEALSRARLQVEEERAGLQKLQDELNAEEERLRNLGRELDQKSAIHAEAVAPQQEALALSLPLVPAVPAPEAAADSPVTAPPSAPADAPRTPQPPGPSPVSETSILGRLAILAASPPEARPANGKPAPMPDIPPPEGEAPDRKVLYRVKCPGCKNVIPVFTRERPLKIKCDACGKEGVLK